MLTVPTRGNKKPAPTLARTSRIGNINPVSNKGIKHIINQFS